MKCCSVPNISSVADECDTSYMPSGVKGFSIWYEDDRSDYFMNRKYFISIEYHGYYPKQYQISADDYLCVRSSIVSKLPFSIPFPLK